MRPTDSPPFARKMSVGLYDDDLFKIEIEISTEEIQVRFSRNSQWKQIVASLQPLVTPSELACLKAVFEESSTERTFEVQESLLIIRPKSSD